MSLRWFCGNFHSARKVAKPLKAGLIKEMQNCCLKGKQSHTYSSNVLCWVFFVNFVIIDELFNNSILLKGEIISGIFSL